jgi:acyl-CoA thioester hydrolase
MVHLQSHSKRRGVLLIHFTNKPPSLNVQFFAPLGFPQVLDLGLRVNKLGSSSVTYEVGVFEQGKDSPAAVGGYTHVFVGSVSRKSTPMAERTKEGLRKLLRGAERTAKL